MEARGQVLQAYSRQSEALLRIYERFSSFTMVPREGYLTNLRLAQRHSPAPGAIVECGTWKGGMIAGIAQLLGKDREYWLFDSFEGLPPAREIDGEAARRWQADKDSPEYYDNCTASEDDARRAMALSGAGNFQVRKGWFADTLPRARFEAGISLLRIDADWYDSTLTVLNAFWPQVNAGGGILIDDYYQWDGCAQAVHDFLSRFKARERIQSLGGVCFLVKHQP